MPEKKLYDLTVDPEFRDLIPPLNEEEPVSYTHLTLPTIA